MADGMQIPLREDLLTGARAIAEFLGWPERRVYYVVENHCGWPIWREPGTGITARRSSLTRHIEKRERAAVDGHPNQA